MIKTMNSGAACELVAPKGQMEPIVPLMSPVQGAEQSVLLQTPAKI